MELKSDENCLAHALIIAIAGVEYDANYKAYRQGWNIRPVVQTLEQQIGIDLTSGEGFPNLTV